MSIDVNVQNDLVIVTESSEDITVNVSNAAGPAGPAGANGVGVPVGGTTGQVLKKLSNTNYDTYWALDGGGVPYSGATGDVNLGEFQLRAGQLTLDTSPTGTAAVGTTRWNDTIGSSETTLKGGSVILKNGVDLVARVVNKVSPNTTLTKAAYQAVRVSGAQGQRLAVAFAQANNDANSADTIGLVCETIATNQEGFIITVGQLENINTTGSLQGETWADGDVLYLSPFTPGAITKVKPTGNGHIVVIGYVEYAHQNNGKIYVKVMNGWELEELHNVDIVTPANNEALIYESSTALWKNKTIASALGYTPISGTGATGQVAYWNGTSSQTGSSGLVYSDSTGEMTLRKDVNSAAQIIVRNLTNSTSAQSALSAIASNGNITLGKYSATTNTYRILVANDGYIYNSSGSASDIAIYNDAVGGKIKFATNSVSTAQMTLTAAGRLLLGSTSEGTQLLQVYGDAFVKGSGATSATNALLVQNSAGTQQLIFNNAGQAMFGVNVPSTNVKLETDGTFRAWTQVEVGQFGNVVINTTQLSKTASGSDFFQFTNGGSHTAINGTYYFLQLRNTVNPTSGIAVVNGLNLNFTINQTGGANGITRGLYVNPTLTAAADWRSIEWSNNSGWGLYGAGTAPNYLGGRLAIGSATANTIWTLNVDGIANISRSVGNPSLSFNNNAGLSSAIAYLEPTSSEFHIYAHTGRSIAFTSGAAASRTMTLTASGRLLLGTTTEGTFLLDVNGTARVSGASTFGGNMALTLNQNLPTTLIITNTTSASNAGAAVTCQTDALSGGFTFGKWSTANLPVKIVSAGDAYLYNTLRDIAILNDAATGTIKMAAGGSSTAHFTIKANGRINMSSLPTSSAGLSAGDLWNDGGTLKIV